MQMAFSIPDQQTVLVVLTLKTTALYLITRKTKCAQANSREHIHQHQF